MTRNALLALLPLAVACGPKEHFRPPTSPHASHPVSVRAPLDLDCSAESIQMEPVDDRNVAAIGCGQRATYARQCSHSQSAGSIAANSVSRGPGSKDSNGDPQPYASTDCDWVLRDVRPLDVAPTVANAAESTRYVFYLHGRIVQEQGPEAVSEEFGPYRYAEIVDALRAEGVEVRAPLRQPDDTVEVAARSLSQAIRRLLDSGVPAPDITVVGASQGAMIAMETSSELKDPQLGFVLMGACNAETTARYDGQVSGRFLSVYESGDRYGASCADLVGNGESVSGFTEVALSTGDGHGFLYTPRDEWLKPTLDFIFAQKADSAPAETP